MTLVISTPHMERYLVNEEGYIYREGTVPSDKWRMLGLSHVRKNWIIPFSSITPELLKTLPILFKNGNPQFTVRDDDHGTTREWGNTRVHGVKHIYFRDDGYDTTGVAVRKGGGKPKTRHTHTALAKMR